MRRVTGSKGGPAIKRPTQTKTKPGMKPGNGTTKQVSPQQSDEAPPAKKKKKPAALQVGPGPDCLVYLTDIPKDATEQEVINLAGSFGPINNVLLLPGSDEEEENGLQASVCMIKPEDAQAFVNSPTRLIRDHVITASVAKKPDDEKPDDANSATKSEQSNDPEREGDQISEKKGVVMIEGLPESGWSEDDLIKMAEPFGFPSDIILAKQIGKALLSLPEVETAVEMVKVHTFNPATINEHKLKMSRVKKIVSIANPVALYNLLIEPTEGVKNVKPVGWSMLVVVSNIPEVPSSASVVQKLVSRIGTVLRSLVVNDMVICEMATGLLAAAVYKHYTRFPCIIQNNPLIFSRKPDLKAQTKVSNPDAGKDTPENKKDAPTQANQEESVVKEDSTEEEKIKDVEMKSEKPEEEVVGENTSKETSDEAKDDVKTDPNTEADNETETVETETVEKETETVETETVETETKTPDDVEMEPVEENKRNNASPAENDDKTPAGDETKTPAAGEATSEEKTVKAEAPKVVSTDAQKAQTKPAESKQRQTSMEKTKDPAKDKREEERRRPERERKERETREREKREQEKREREKIRKEREREDRAKKERERRGDWRRDESRRERERRERDRKELERRDRKRPYGDRERRSSSERNRRGHWREDRWKSSSERSMVDEEQVDDFPFNLSDFVTVDEVGDVDPADIPDVPPADIETTKTGKDPSEPSQQQPEVSSETATKPGKEVPAVKDEAEAQEKTPTDKEPASSSAAEDGKAVDEAVDEAADVSDLTNLPPEAVPVVTNEKDQDDPTPPQQDTSEDQDDPTPPQQDTSEVSATATGNEEEEEEMMEVKDEAQEREAVKEAQEETQEKAEAQNEGKDGAQNEGKDGAQNEGKDEAQNEGKDEAQNEGKEEQKILADIKSSRPAAENEKSENTEKDDITENSPDQSEVSSDYSLPPFDPSNPVGMEYLVPMTGFFCKVCTRFFTGTKDTEISHSKTLKHYENLEKFLNARKTSPASSVKGGST